MDHQLSFGRFRFEPATARLFDHTAEIKLTRKAAQVLAALLERPGEPVSKQELFANVWRGTVVSDDALVTCIQELRKALRDDSKQPQYIETRQIRTFGRGCVRDAGADRGKRGHHAARRRAEQLYPDDIGVILNGACLRASIGMKDEALDLLERVLDKGWGKKDWIENDPDYDSLRTEPRFIGMMAKLK